MITFDNLKQAAGVFQRINELRGYVTRERFDLAAKTCYGISDETTLDVMYGMLQMTPRLVYYIANFDDESKGRSDIKYLELLPKTIEIAEAAYSLKADDWEAERVPHIEKEGYRREDMRRYFYKENGARHHLDVCLSERSGIMLLSELLGRGGVKLTGVAEHLGYLEGKMKRNAREKFQYFDGDIYFLYCNPTDRIFYDYLHSDAAGVYIATSKGWRKLFYTPTRGYMTKDGRLDFADDKHFYSDYMLEASGKGFLYVGNINDDCSVLREKGEQTKNS